MKRHFTKETRRGGEITAHAGHRFHSSGGRTILLVSQDEQFHQNLRSLANTLGVIVVKAQRPAATSAVLHATRPVAVLLDLDLPNGAGWESADILLNEPDCPAIVLLSAQTSQFDMRTAIRSGSLVSKSTSPHRLLEIIEERLQSPEGGPKHGNAIQRVLIRWLRPSSWRASTTPAVNRFWGLNE
jgi:DNA-binding response OmpR family regulator